MQIYNQNNEKIICPQLTCIFLIFFYIIILIESYNDSIYIFYISLLIIFIYATIYYIINKGIKYKNYNKYIYGLFISVIYSIVSTLLKISFFIILAILENSTEDNNNNDIYEEPSESEDLFLYFIFFVFINIFLDWILTYILICYKKKSNIFVNQ